MAERGTESGLNPVNGQKRPSRKAKRTPKPRPPLDPRWKDQLRAALNSLRLSQFGEK